jgi:hypothetical protein
MVDGINMNRIIGGGAGGGGGGGTSTIYEIRGMDCSCFYVYRGCSTNCERDISDHIYIA